MPTELLPGISEDDKTMLLIDTSETLVPYIFGEIRKVKQSNDFLMIETSGIGSTQLKLLPVLGDSIILGVIKTVCGGVDAGVCDSDVSFYTTGWEKLDSKDYLRDISVEIFFDSSKKDSENYKYALSLPGIYPVSAKFNDNSTGLLLTLHHEEFLAGRQIIELTPFLKSGSVLLEWDGTSFRE